MKRIFIVILFAIMMVLATATYCPEHYYTIETKQFLWPRASSSDIWIAHNCLDIEKRLIFRQCLNGIWAPDNIDFQNKCKFENFELRSYDCPYNFKPLKLQGSFPRTICVREGGIQYSYITDRSVCIQDNIFTMDLSNEEQTQFISMLTQEFPDHNGLFALDARWRYPAKEISKFINYVKEDVELHDVRCGRFELPLLFNSTVAVYCTEDICASMCLYINVTTYPFSRLVDTCSEYVIARPKNTFLHPIGCHLGYYRTEWDYVETGLNSCFSIQMFSEPISVGEVEYANLIQPFCNGTMMPLSYGDDLFVFRQLSEQLGLSNGNYCLFGLDSRRVIEYNQWNSNYASQIKLFNFNWDKTMNYSHIIDPSRKSYLAVKPNGQWTWATDSVSCVVCMANDPVPDAELQLSYDILQRKLVLDVTNPDFLIKEKSSDLGFICFSLFRGVFQVNLTAVPIGYGKYLIEDVGIGQYWCSGHNIVNRLYRSASTGPYQFVYGVWFSFQIERKCTSECSFSPDDLSPFLDFFISKNGFSSVKDSTIVEHEHPRSDREYTFTALLSLTLHSKEINNLATNLVNLTDYQLEMVSLYNQLSKERFYEDFSIETVRSNEYCLHEPPLSLDAIIWRIARIGETISLSSLCPSEEGGSEITRTCYGDHVNGSYWGNVVNATSCHTSTSESLLTLFNGFIYSSQTTTILEYLQNLLQENIKILMPLDVFLTSRILLKVSEVTFDDIQNIFLIYNSLMEVRKDFLTISASSNSTNALLETFANILLNHFESSISDSKEYRDFGNSSIHSPLIKTFVLDLHKSEASGIALYRPRDSSSDDDFNKYSLRFVYPNETVEDLTKDETKTGKDLVVGAYIPSDLLTVIENTSVLMTVFFNDKLFQYVELLPETRYFETNGKIVSVKIVGLDDPQNLPHKIPIFFETNQYGNLTCGYWNLASTHGWSCDGCILKEKIGNQFQQIALCECAHSSYFGYLKNGELHKHEIHNHTSPLIKVIASSLSLVSVSGIFITAAIFKKWRKKLSSRILVNFAVAITLEMFLIMLINVDQRFPPFIANNAVACTTLGSAIHYSILVVFFWTLILSYFQLRRCVVFINFKVSHLFLKAIIFGWVVPLLPVIATVIIDHSLYLSENNGRKFCHLTGWALYIGVVAPITLIFLVDATAFMLVLIGLHIASRSIAEETKFRMALSQILLSAFLFIILGLTATLGLLSEMFPHSNSVVSVIFCVTATIQGLILFLNFIVFDLAVRNLWLRYARKLMWHLYGK